MTIESKGDQFGIRLVPRGKNDSHICVQIISEDDGEWFERQLFSSAWLGDLIEQLHIAEVLLLTQEIDKHGYKFKNTEKNSNL